MTGHDGIIRLVLSSGGYDYIRATWHLCEPGFDFSCTEHSGNENDRKERRATILTLPS